MALLCMALAGEARSETLRIRIADMAFGPDEVRARLGDVVEWRNDDFVDHTATDRGGRFDVTIPAGQSGTATLTRRGRFPYLCRFHPNMAGLLIVE
jgi:plastocyanin